MKLNSTIYIKAPKKVVLYKKRSLTIGDIVAVHSNKKIANHIKTIQLCKIKDPHKNHNFVISIMDVIKAINKEYPSAVIINLGEEDTLIHYENDIKTENKIITISKVIFVCFILMCGSAMAIMTFHTDAAVPNVFTTVNEIFTGEFVERPLWIIIPYSIGLTLGVVVFFNHISSKKITEDPTPIQVEMRKYEDDVDDCLIMTINSEDSGEDE